MIFSTSVASLSLGLGAVAVSAPQPLGAAPWQRCWLLLMPAVALVMLAGFHGNLTVFHAVLLLIEGTMIVLVWKDPAQRVSMSPTALTPFRPRLPGPWLFAGAVVVGVVGAAFAAYNAMRLQASMPLLGSGIIVSVGLAPLLARRWRCRDRGKRA